MFTRTSLRVLALVTLALSLAAKTVIIDSSSILSVPLTRAQNFNNGHNLLEAGLIRAKNLRSHTQNLGELKKRQLSVPATNTAVYYTASVGVGEPATQYELLVDTGSSNTWVGGDQPYTATSTSRNTGNTVSVQYGVGSSAAFFSGTEYLDQVTLAPGLVISNQSIGVASESMGFDGSSGFDGLDGVLGIGPTILSAYTVENVFDVPTVTDKLFDENTIPQRVVGISFEPSNTTQVTNGELTFGHQEKWSEPEVALVVFGNLGNLRWPRIWVIS